MRNMDAEKPAWLAIITIAGCGFSIFSSLLGIGYISLGLSGAYAPVLPDVGAVLGASLLFLGIFGFGAYWLLWNGKGFARVMAINIVMVALMTAWLYSTEADVLAPVNFLILWGAGVAGYLTSKRGFFRPESRGVLSCAS